MRQARDVGEPITKGRHYRREADKRALSSALFGSALFGGVVLVNGILFILLLELVRILAQRP